MFRPIKITPTFTDKDVDFLDIYIKEISRYSPMTAEEEVEAITKYHNNGDMLAREQLIQANLLFVVSVAKKFQHKGLSLGDLIGFGNLGLARAVETFDPTKGFKFISYAVFWIRFYIMRALTNNGRLIRLPSNQVADLYKIKEQQEISWGESNEMYSIGELADLTDLPEEKIEYYMTLPLDPISLDKPVIEDEPDKLSDCIKSTIPDTDDDLENESLRTDIQRTMSVLTDKERYIITHYFGLFGEQVKTSEELANDLSITKETVRQCRQRGLSKLQDPSIKKLLSKYI